MLNKPWATIKEDYAKIQMTKREAQYLCLQELVKLESILLKNRKLFTMFCEESFWKDKGAARPRKIRKNTLFHRWWFMCGDEPNADKNASLYSRALKQILKEEVPQHQIAGQLKDRGGIYKLAKDYAATRATSTGSPKTVGVDALTNRKSNDRPQASSLEIEVSRKQLDGLFKYHKGDTIAILMTHLGEKSDGWKRFKLFEHFKL